MEAIYVSLRSPSRDDDAEAGNPEADERTRLRISQTPQTPLAVPGSAGALGMERSVSAESDASRKRRREAAEGDVVGNGELAVSQPPEKRAKVGIPERSKTDEEMTRVRNGNARNENGKLGGDDDNVSEEGELDE